jgi:chemotaxis protein MotB
VSRRKKHAEHENHERWLVSYADFITLLFAFFVVLYASSQVDKKKMGQLASAIESAFQEMGVFQGKSIAPPTEDGGGGPSKPAAATEFGRLVAPKALHSDMSSADIGGLKRELETALAPEIQRREIALRIGPEGLVVSLREVGFFDSGSAILRKTSEPAFARISDLLRQYPCNIRVEGHTDNVPIHTAQFASNWELSTARATEVIRKFIVQYKFAPDRLSAAGYGEYHPAALNNTEEGRRMNRRIDLVILGVSKHPATAFKVQPTVADEEEAATRTAGAH